MGEMADWINQDDPWLNDNIYEYQPHYTQCRHCKCCPLYWRETDGGWRLFDEDDKLHECKEYKKCQS